MPGEHLGQHSFFFHHAGPARWHFFFRRTRTRIPKPRILKRRVKYTPAKVRNKQTYTVRPRPRALKLFHALSKFLPRSVSSFSRCLRRTTQPATDFLKRHMPAKSKPNAIAILRVQVSDGSSQSTYLFHSN